MRCVGKIGKCAQARHEVRVGLLVERPRKFRVSVAHGGHHLGFEGLSCRRGQDVDLAPVLRAALAFDQAIATQSVDDTDQAGRGDETELAQLSKPDALAFPQDSQDPPLCFRDPKLAENGPKTGHHAVQRAVKHHRHRVSEVLH